MQLINNYFPTSPYHNRIYFGQSGTGKTQHLINYVLKFNEFYPDTQIRKIIVIAPQFLKEYEILWNKYKDLCHFSDVFNEEIVENFGDSHENTICIVIIDDFASTINKSPILEKIFTTMTRHKKLQLNFVCQGLYSSNSEVYKSIMKNGHILILMNSPRERNSIQVLFRQLFGSKTTRFANFVLKEALKENQKRYNNPYYNISINLTPECTEEVKVLSDILSPYPIAYIKQ